MNPSVGARSDVGRVRDGNEDSYLVQAPIYVVADGMGGHVAGDVASRIAVETISSMANDGTADEPAGLESAVKAANKAIWEKAHEDQSLRGMGTTCTLVLVGESEVHLAHVGDSRAYLLRAGELSQISDDHTLVGRMVKEGRLSPEEAEHHPQRNIITRVLGVDQDVEVDITSIPVQEGDTILICSDGLSSMVESDAIRDVLVGTKDPQRAADDLIDLANDAGGEDNITAVVLAFDGNNNAVGNAAGADTLTQEVARADVPRRQEGVQPGARAHNVTGVFEAPARPETPTRRRKAPAAASRRRGHPVLVTVLLVLFLVVAGAVAFKFWIVDNSYYVAATSDGRLAIYQGLPDQVLGMTFQEQIEVSDTNAADLPAFLMEDVEDAIEADSLDDARQTLANLEQRASDEEFQKSGTNQKGDNQ